MDNKETFNPDADRLFHKLKADKKSEDIKQFYIKRDYLILTKINEMLKMLLREID